MSNYKAMKNIQTPLEALKAAVAHVGSQSELARICGVSQPTVWKWLQSSKRMPAEYVLPTEAATGISRHLLRPDIYPRDANHMAYRAPANSPRHFDRNAPAA